jgi:DNA repair protein RadA/Sms
VTVCVGALGKRGGVPVAQTMRVFIRRQCGGICGGAFLRRLPLLRLFATSSSAKRPLRFVCSSCGDDHAKWWGTCPTCRSVNTVSEFREPVAPAPGGGGSGANVSPAALRAAARGWLDASSTSAATQLTPLHAVPLQGASKTSLGSPELDGLLGGGLTAGSSVLFAGSPGVGKSTLLLQVAVLLCGGRARGGAPYAQFFCGNSDAVQSKPPSLARLVAYVSGEESAAQIAGRAARLGFDAPGLQVLNETRLEDVLTQLGAAAEAGARSGAGSLAAVVVDSVQTLWYDGLSAPAGTVSQVRECAVRLTAWAKAVGVPVVMAGHVTKSGDIAGPRVLEHIVDTVLFMEGEEGSGGDVGGGSGSGGGWWGGGGGGGSGGAGAPLPHGHRMVRALKNRFGGTSEVALLELGGEGFREAAPASLFLSRSGSGAPPPSGCAVAVTAAGSRAMCVEVQALVSPTPAGPFPRQRAMGVPGERLAMLAAVLARFGGLRRGAGVAGCDLLVNVVGGMRLNDPSADLAVVLALASSASGVPLPAGVAALGEVGLTGELRGCGGGRAREALAASAKLGFSKLLLPRAAAKGLGGGACEVVPVGSVEEAIRAALPEALSGGGGAPARSGKSPSAQPRFGGGWRPQYRGGRAPQES